MDAGWRAYRHEVILGSGADATVAEAILDSHEHDGLAYALWRNGDPHAAEELVLRELQAAGLIGANNGDKDMDRRG